MDYTVPYMKYLGIECIEFVQQQEQQSVYVIAVLTIALLCRCKLDYAHTQKLSTTLKPPQKPHNKSAGMSR